DRTYFKENDLYWNENIKKLQDIDYFIKLFLLVSRFSYVEEILFHFVEHQNARITTSSVSNPYRPVLRSMLSFVVKKLHRIQISLVPSLAFLFMFLIYKSSNLGMYPTALRIGFIKRLTRR